VCGQPEACQGKSFPVTILIESKPIGAILNFSRIKM
jgi:hypothetical protein